MKATLVVRFVAVILIIAGAFGCFQLWHKFHQNFSDTWMSNHKNSNNNNENNNEKDRIFDIPQINYLSSFVHKKIIDTSLIHRINLDIDNMLDSRKSRCMVAWPLVKNCVKWYISSEYNMRYLLTNSVPVYFVAPYCPFGIGDGYCFTGQDHKNCSLFYNMSCPAQAHRENTLGDVVVAQLYLYGIPLNPNPLNDSLPFGIYERDSLLWAYNNGSNNNNNNDYVFNYTSVKELEMKTGLWKYSDLLDSDDSTDDMNVNDTEPAWAVIALHLTGQQIKGPDEAEGMNVDYAGLHLETMCGGHVTPPIDLGPLYHYHKAALCLEKFPMPLVTDNDRNSSGSISDEKIFENENKNVESKTEERQNEKQLSIHYPHSSLQGYGNDGFGIYGLYDFDMEEPILDECNGHFGAVGKYRNGKVIYHYHYRNTTWDWQDKNSTFLPYYLGCQGPSKGACNETINGEISEYGSAVCGPGCGFQICVQPGTSKRQLKKYLSSWGNRNWLDQFTVNPY